MPSIRGQWTAAVYRIEKRHLLSRDPEDPTITQQVGRQSSTGIELAFAAEPIPGYMHRGYEKLTEVRSYPQINTLINRIDWLGSFANEVPFILAAEKLMGVEAPPRAQWIRTILFEMSRIANISLFLGDYGLQLGGMTAGFYAFRDREHVLNQIEAATGGRFHPNFDRIGGLKDDLPKGWIDETKLVMERQAAYCDEIEDLVLGSEIFEARCRR